jgi:hypothetical protein
MGTYVSGQPPGDAGHSKRLWAALIAGLQPPHDPDVATIEPSTGRVNELGQGPIVGDPV